MFVFSDRDYCVQLEFKFAKQQGLPIVTVMMETNPGWKPTHWLGLLTAGSLWTSLDDDDLVGTVDNIIQQIKKAVPQSGDDRVASTLVEELEEPKSVQKTQEMKDELTRLQADLEAAVSRSKPPSRASLEGKPIFEAGGLAVVPGLVPELPSDFRETDSIREIKRLLTVNDATVRRVGFWGGFPYRVAVFVACLSHGNAVIMLQGWVGLAKPLHPQRSCATRQYDEDMTRWYM